MFDEALPAQVLGDPGRLRQFGRIRAAQLQGDRVLVRIKAQQTLAIAMDLGRDALATRQTGGTPASADGAGAELVRPAT